MKEPYIQYESAVDMLVTHGLSKFNTPFGKMSGWETIEKMWIPYTPDKMFGQLNPVQRMQRKAWGETGVRLLLNSGDIYIKNGNEWTDFNMKLQHEE